MIVLTVLFVILTIVGIVGIPIAVSNTFNSRSSDDDKFLATMMIGIYLVFNFGVLGGLFPHLQDTHYISDFDYTKFDSGISVSFEHPETDDSEIITFKDAKTFNMISDSSFVRVRVNKNIYNAYLDSDYTIVNKKQQ